MKALEKNPEDRYDGCGEFLRYIEDYEQERKTRKMEKSRKDGRKKYIEDYEKERKTRGRKAEKTESVVGQAQSDGAELDLPLFETSTPDRHTVSDSTDSEPKVPDDGVSWQDLAPEELADAPKLQLLPEHGPLRISVFQVQKPIRKFLKAKNKGTGDLEIFRVAIAPEKSDDDGPDWPDLNEMIRLERGQEQVPVSDRFDQDLALWVNPEKIPVRDLLLRINCRYRFWLNDRWVNREYSRELLIEVVPLKNAALLAVYLGAQNSYCAVVTEETDPPKVVSLDLDENDLAIPSFIGYHYDDVGTIIGTCAEIKAKKGDYNAKNGSTAQFVRLEPCLQILSTRGRNRSSQRNHARQGLHSRAGRKGRGESWLPFQKLRIHAP